MHCIFFCLFIITDIYLYFILRYSQIYAQSYIIISVYQLNCFDKNKTGLTPRHYMYQLAITYFMHFLLAADKRYTKYRPH